MYRTEGRTDIDNALSSRDLEMDPKGFCVVRIDSDSEELVVLWYTAHVNERGIVCDPNTGRPIPAGGAIPYDLSLEFRGRTAKELCVEMFEASATETISLLAHAAYLGRELVFAELALREARAYVQD